MVLHFKSKSHLIFNLFLVLLITLLFARYAFSMNISKTILTLVITGIALVGSRDEILAISLCCIPLHEAVDFYLALTVCAVLYILKSFRSIKLSVPFVLCLVIITWELIHFAIDGFDFGLMVTSLVPFIFVTIICCSDVSDIDYAFIVRMVAVTSIAVGIMFLVHCIVNANFNFVTAFMNLRRLGHLSENEILKGGAINPNTLGIINVLTSATLLQLRNISCNKRSDYIYIVILLSLGVLTSSRTFLACLVIMLFLFIVGQKGNIRKKIKFLGILLLLIIVTLILMQIFFPTLIEYYVGRFRVDDITTGRDTLIKVFHHFIVSNPSIMFFGIGLAGYGDKLVKIYRVTNNIPHNSIQEIIIAWGIPGLLLITALIFSIVIQSKRYNKQTTLHNYVPLIIIIVKSMAGQLITSGYTILALAFAYLSLCQNFNQTGNKEPTPDQYLIRYLK